MAFIKERILSRREGQIFFWGSITYILLYVLSITIVPKETPFKFILWMGAFMPIALAIFYFKIGGFKKEFESSTMDTIYIVGVLLVPVLVTIYSKLS